MEIEVGKWYRIVANFFDGSDLLFYPVKVVDLSDGDVIFFEILPKNPVSKENYIAFAQSEDDFLAHFEEYTGNFVEGYSPEVLSRVIEVLANFKWEEENGD